MRTEAMRSDGGKPSAAADHVRDLHCIARFEVRRAELFAQERFAVELDHYGVGHETQLFYELGDRRSALDRRRPAVHTHRHCAHAGDTAAVSVMVSQSLNTGSYPA